MIYLLHASQVFTNAKNLNYVSILNLRTLSQILPQNGGK